MSTIAPPRPRTKPLAPKHDPMTKPKIIPMPIWFPDDEPNHEQPTHVPTPSPAGPPPRVPNTPKRITTQ